MDWHLFSGSAKGFMGCSQTGFVLRCVIKVKNTTDKTLFHSMFRPSWLDYVHNKSLVVELQFEHRHGFNYHSLWFVCINNDSAGNVALLKEKIDSITGHICNIHTFPDNSHHLRCCHGPLDVERPRAWLNPDSLVSSIGIPLRRF